jgi:hypothetical protein
MSSFLHTPFTSFEERLQAFCLENEIPGQSVLRVYHESGGRSPIALPTRAWDLARLQLTKGDADRHRE